MLRALRRILRPGGRLAFTTIERAPGLTRTQRRAMADTAPRAVGTRYSYREMLDRAGYRDIGSRDLTDEYLQTLRAWVAATEPVRDEVAQIDGVAETADRLQRWRDAAGFVERGWLRRSLYWATAP